MEDMPGKIHWHPGFAGAMELELRANASNLTFSTQVELSKEPLRIDLLVVESGPGTKIENELGNIFRHFNIMEYKSPDDELSIDDFFKTIGYACIFKGLGRTVNEFPEEEITVSLFRDTVPLGLFQDLRASGRTVENVAPGIYLISGSLPFVVQIVVTRLLDHEKHRALCILSENAQEDDVRSFIEGALELKNPGDRHNIGAVLEVSIAANKALYDEIRRDGKLGSAMEELMKDVIEKREEEARREDRLDCLRIVMSQSHYTAEQAMDYLLIPSEERSYYLQYL